MIDSLSLPLVLLLLALTCALAFIISNRHSARQIARQATKRGWRYIMPEWYRLFSLRIRLAGQTPSDSVWELSQVWDQKTLLYRWQAYSAPLPYGSVTILPAAAEMRPERETVKMIAVPPPADSWPAAFQLYTTHAQLARIFADEQLIASLRQFHTPPGKGSLINLSWRERTLLIVCTYEKGWEILDKLVGLGEATLAAAK